MKCPVLIIDDELQICESVQMILEYEGYEVDYATSGEEGLKRTEQRKYDVVLLDINLPGKNGFEVLQQIKSSQPDVHVVMISAFSNIENAVKATKLGAFDFIEKPVDRDKLIIVTRNAARQSALISENLQMKKSIAEEVKFIGSSKATERLLDLIEKVAPTDVRVLITGENGTGKEVLARMLHEHSDRAKKPFIDINCAAIPNELIESELFGHEKGSFTGANQQRAGKFELADTGTLFLDEIGDMAMSAQAKVLRAIEDGRIERVGGSKKIEVDVRIIAATNKNLEEEIHKGNFREDLYHRLNVIPVYIPPLRERPDDIPDLIIHFTKLIAEKHKKPVPVFAQSAVSLLQSMQWQGNIRELRNIIERIIIIVSKSNIESGDIQFLVPGAKSDASELLVTGNSFQEFKEKAERAFILKQLEQNNWNVSKTAEALDIQRSHLYNRMKKYGLMKENENE